MIAGSFFRGFVPVFFAAGFVPCFPFVAAIPHHHLTKLCTDKPMPLPITARGAGVITL
jgi:hypothetical protein